MPSVHRLDGVDDEPAVDGDADPHVVHRLARGSHAGQQFVIVILGIDDVRLDVEQPIVAAKPIIGDRTAMQPLARHGGRRHRHGRTKSEAWVAGVAGSPLANG